MKVEIRGVIDFKKHASERIVLDVKEDTDIGKYLLLDTTYTSDGKVSNKVRHPFWFPDKKVKKGDVVVLYTKKGVFSTKVENGNTIFLFYWGLNSSIWNDDGDCAVLMHVDEWTSKKAN